MKRRAALLKLAAEYEIARRSTYDECENSSEEDLMEMLDGEVPIDRFALVTGGGEFTYIKTFPKITKAEARAVAYINDDIYAEYPLEIVDLDKGRRKRAYKFVAIWSRWS